MAHSPGPPAERAANGCFFTPQVFAAAPAGGAGLLGLLGRQGSGGFLPLWGGPPVRFGDFPAVESHAGTAWSSWYFPPGEKQAYKGEGIATQHHLRSNPFWIDWKTGSTDEAAKCRLREILWQKKAYFRRNTLCISRKYNAFMPLNCRKMPKACFFRDS